MSDLGTTRRTFLKTVGATTIAIAAYGASGATSAAAAAAPPARGLTRTGASAPRFDIAYDDSVRVRVTSGRRFDVTVTDRDGNVLERHRRLNVGRLTRVRSRHFTVSPLPDDLAA